MRKIILRFGIVMLIIAEAGVVCYPMSVKKEPMPKELIAKSVFGKKGTELGEFENLFSLAIKGNYLFVADSGNSRIQVLEIKSDGNLTPKFSFGKRGKGKGEFIYPFGLVTKDNYLYVADTGNNRIQGLEIKY
ncbi:MAG: hypothetical protein KKH34_08100 [Candidatus Omnitrophica bacterium]|nr:hypothetical protein [Candidatus Omnitrophota bacterium]MCG2703054.1 hypothetical protein [Candidatus Omnitrophota bacterium]